MRDFYQVFKPQPIILISCGMLAIKQLYYNNTPSTHCKSATSLVHVFRYHSPENVQYWGCIYLEMWGEAWNCRSVSNICLPCSSKRLTFRYLLSSGTRSKVTSASGFEDFGTSESYIQHNYSINNKFLTLNCIRILFYLWGFLYVPEFYETESK